MPLEALFKVYRTAVPYIKFGFFLNLIQLVMRLTLLQYIFQH